MIRNKTGRANDALIAVGSKSGINLLDRFDDSMVDYLSAEVLLQQAFSIRSDTFGVDHPRARASAKRLLQVYDAQQGGRTEEAAELRADPQKHLRRVNLRIAELERAVGTFSVKGGSTSGGGKSDPADVEQRLVSLFKEKWARAAAERARERIRTRGFREHVAANEGKGSRGGVLLDSEAHLDAEVGGLLNGISTKIEGGQDAIAAETDFEATQAAIAIGVREGFESEEAVRRAIKLLKRQDYFLAVQSCMSSLGQNVRDPAAIQVLQESLRQISAFPKKEDFRAEVKVSLGPAARGVLGERFTVRYSYQNRETPDHAHPAKDWVGLFLLDSPRSITTSTPNQEHPKSPPDALGHPSDGRRFAHRPGHSQNPSGHTTTANNGHSEREKDTKAPAAATAHVEGSAGESTEAGVTAEKPRTRGVTKKAEGDTDADALDAKHELGGGRSEDTRYFRSSQVAATFVGGIPMKTAAIGGAGIVAEESALRGKKEQLPGKMVGWRTLPRENEGMVAVDEGIVTLEGVYVVRYFLGGSTCCVAESKEFQVEYSFNFATAMPKEDWLGVVGWGEEPSASTCVLRKSLLETSSGAVLFEEGPPLPGKYAVYAFLTESDDAVVGSSAMFECIGAFDANQARQARCRREFTLYLSTRWDMNLERSTFKAAVAPALKQMLDARGVSFGYMDPRSDLGVEDLKTPRGVDAVLNILQPDYSPSSAGDRSLPACSGQFNPAASLLTVTDLEVLAAFLLPVLQETIQAESGFDTSAAGKRVRLAAVPGGARRHACIVNALADFRRLTVRQREGDGDEGGRFEGSGNRADGSRDKTSMAATAYAPPSALSPGLVTQGAAVPRRGFMTENAFFYTRAACLRSELHPSQKMGAGGIAGVIRFINGSKLRMTQLKHELAAATNRFRQGYQDENALLSMVLEDLSRAIDTMYPLRTAPDRLDDASLFPHVSARRLLDLGVVQLPVVRYRGFRPDPPPATSAVAAGLSAGSAAACAVSSTTGQGVVATAAAASAAAAAAASAAWRLQQRLEFIQFEERIKRVSGEARGESEGGDRSDGGGGWANEGPAAEVAPSGDSGVGGRCSDRNTKAGSGGALTTSADSGGDTTGVGRDTAGVAMTTAPAVAAAKRLVVVLADYVEDKTTIGMVVVDQPGTGMTTALLGFLDWYCRGGAAGGRQGVTVVEALDSIPQYGRCNLSRAVITRPRLVARDANDGRLVHEMVERRTLVLRVDCRDCYHGPLDNARLVHYLSCEIIRTFGMPYKMPDRPGLSSRSDTGIISDQPSVHDYDHGHDDDEGVVNTQDHSDGFVDGHSSAAEVPAVEPSTATRGGGGGNIPVAAAPSVMAVGGDAGIGSRVGEPVEVGPQVLGRWLDLLSGYGDLVLIVENPDVLLPAGERAHSSPEQAPNPLAWLPAELPSHVKVITTCTQGSSCQQLLCGSDGWGWHLLRRKSGLDAETKAQVIDAVLRRHGVGCMLDWVETDLVLKEKTTNIQFLVGVTEALCYSGLLANSGLAPGLHKATGVGSRPSSPPSVTSATNARSPSSAATRAGAAIVTSCGRGDSGGGLSDADVAALRGAATSMMHEESALDITRLRIRQLVSIKGRRGCILRAALCLVRLSHRGERNAQGSNERPGGGLAAGRGGDQSLAATFDENEGAPEDVVVGDANASAGEIGEGSAKVNGRASGGERAVPSAVTSPAEKGEKETTGGTKHDQASRLAFAEQDWRALEPDLTQFCHKALGRLFLRDYTTISAVDQELIHHHPDLPDKFVVRANQHHPAAHSSPIASGYGATSLSSPTGGAGSGGGLMDDKVTHYYYQILADSFAKELPGVRRAEEQLAALAAIVVLSAHSGGEAPRRASRPHRDKLFATLANVEILYAMNGSKRGDPQAYLEYMHLAHVFAAPRRFMSAVRSSFEECYNVVPHETAHTHGRTHLHHPRGGGHQDAQLLYTVNGIKHPPAATSAAGTEPAQNRKSGGGGGGSGGIFGGGLSEVSKMLAARRGQKPPPPPPLTRAGALRLVEAARLALERLGDADETMNLLESAWALMFGVKDLTDEAFGRIGDVSFPVDKVVDCLRLLAGVYVSRGLDMHLLLFHEAVQIDSTSDNNKNGASADLSSTATGSTASINAHEDGTDGETTTQGSHHTCARLSMAVEAAGDPTSGGAGAGVGGNGRGRKRLSAARITATGKSGRFATAGRVREFRAVLKGAAVHASKMKVAHANRELNIEGAIRGHDVDVAVLNKSTNPGKQSKQQIKRVARAREAVDGMLKRWPLVIERMGICTEQAIKLRNLMKTAGVFPGGGGGSATPRKKGDLTLDTRACERLRASREHARLVEQHAEILVLSLRFERIALAIQRRQEEREYHRLAALGLVPPGVSLSDYRDQLLSTPSKENQQHHRDIHGN
eukprot:g11851.t1